MKNCRNSFLKFLSIELPIINNSSNIVIHVLRKDYDRPEEAQLQVNALNVDFRTMEFRTDISSQKVSLDVIHEVEDTALIWSNDVFDLLSKRFYISKYDYTTPTVPVLLPGTIYWDRNAIDFKEINVDYYARYNCTFNLYHYISLL